jgi:hypothetical protein
LNIKLSKQEQEERIKKAITMLKDEANKVLAHEEGILRSLSQPPAYFFFNFSFNSLSKELPLAITKEEKSINTSDIEQESKNIGKSVQINDELEIINNLDKYNNISNLGEDGSGEKESLEVKKKIQLKKTKRKVSIDENQGIDKENCDINIQNFNNQKKKKGPKHKKPVIIESKMENEIESIRLDESNEMIRIDYKESTPILKRLRVRPNVKKHYCV